MAPPTVPDPAAQCILFLYYSAVQFLRLDRPVRSVYQSASSASLPSLAVDAVATFSGGRVKVLQPQIRAAGRPARLQSASTASSAAGTFRQGRQERCEPADDDGSPRHEVACARLRSVWKYCTSETEDGRHCVSAGRTRFCLCVVGGRFVRLRPARPNTSCRLTFGRCCTAALSYASQRLCLSSFLSAFHSSPSSSSSSFAVPTSLASEGKCGRLKYERLAPSTNWQSASLSSVIARASRRSAAILLSSSRRCCSAAGVARIVCACVCARHICGRY